ncbi:MAG TPA: monofunctional biosynthetic peptidoglycan transglycosylase [Steroidobacteraceae bacterium]|nr:monofunctional biosynthetic peptidoglycan transglycosylase [Steroidobacteraceae bacterium]
MARRRSFGLCLVRAMLGLLVLGLALSALVVLALRWVDPPGSMMMLEARIEAWRADDARYRHRYHWVDMAQVSPYAARAVIAAEDQNFAMHPGFDFEAIRKAAEHNADGRAVRGASTISQQVAKNLFLWRGRSWLRKGLEAWFTVLIETLWPKARILEVYLNIAEFGHGIYGVEAAAQAYWKKSAKALTRSQAATLAAVLPNPRRYRAQPPSPYVQRRRDWILGQMPYVEMPAATGSATRAREAR